MPRLPNSNYIMRPWHHDDQCSACANRWPVYSRIRFVLCYVCTAKIFNRLRTARQVVVN